MNRTVELLTGLIGGIFGLIASVIVVITLKSEVVTIGVWLGFLFSILAIVGSLVVRSKGTVGGIMLIIAAIGVLFSVAIFNIIAALLIFFAGMMGIVKEDPNSRSGYK